MAFTIHPYKSSRYGWTFIDPTTNRGEDENALVAGMDLILDGIERVLGEFSITFSDEELVIEHDHLRKLKWMRGDKKNLTADDIPGLSTGNYYLDEVTGIEGY